MDCSMHLWEAGIYFGTVPGLHEQSHFLLRIHFFKICTFLYSHSVIFHFYQIYSYFIPSILGHLLGLSALHAQYDGSPQVKSLRGFVLKVSTLNKIRRLGRRLSRVFCFDR